ALGRRAATGGHRAGARDRATTAPGRRADGKPRLAHGGGRPRSPAGAERRGAAHDHPGYPQPPRRLLRPPDRRDARREVRARGRGTPRRMGHATPTAVGVTESFEREPTMAHHPNISARALVAQLLATTSRLEETRLVAAAMAPPIPNLVRKEGEYWTIAYEGTLLRLRDGKGL